MHASLIRSLAPTLSASFIPVRPSRPRARAGIYAPTTSTAGSLSWSDPLAPYSGATMLPLL